MRRLALALLLLLVALASVWLWRSRSIPTAVELPARMAEESASAPTASPTLSASEDAKQDEHEARARADAGDGSGAVLEVHASDDLGQPCPDIYISLRPIAVETKTPDLRAQVQAYFASAPQRGTVAHITKQDGRATWTDITAGVPLELAVLNRTHVRGMPSGALTFEPGQRRTLELVLPRLGVVRGRILDAERRPAPRARVQLFSIDENSKPAAIQWNTTDVEGHFEVRGVADGTGWLGADFTTVERDEALVTARWSLAPGAEQDLGDLMPSSRRIALSVRAFDGEGKDVTDLAANGFEARGGAAMSARAAPCWQLSANCRLGASFALLGLPSAPVRIELDLSDLRVADGYRLANAAPSPALELSAVEDVALLRVPVIRARAVTWKAPPIHRANIPDQNGVAELRVVLVPESGAPLTFEMSALLGLEFESIQNLPPGRYTVFAASSYGLDDACARQELSVGDAEGQIVELRIVHGACLAGHVSESRNTFELAPIDPSGERELPWLQQARVDPVGHYVLNGVPPDVPLCIRPGGQKLLTPAGAHALDLVLPRAR